VLEDGSAIQFDGACLRGKCDADPVLGYALMKAFAGLLVRRYMETRLQLIDVYGRRD
jgi:CRP/FNR family transcriptional regulator, cyclic AMP receptor protein